MPLVSRLQSYSSGSGKTFHQRLNPMSVMAGLWLLAGGLVGATQVTSHLNLEQSMDKGQAHLHRGIDFIDRLASEKDRSTMTQPWMRTFSGPRTPKMHGGGLQTA